MIIEKINSYIQSRIKQYPCHTNRASEVGHPCERYLVLIRTRWQEKVLYSIDLQYIFEEGNLHEKDVIQKLAQAGVVIVEQQRSFEWKKYNITGHIDGKVLICKKLIPLEIKSTSPYSFQEINDINSLINSRYWYVRKYPAQLALYMLMDNVDEAIILFKNKVSGRLKEVVINLDYEYAESLIQKVERINKHVEDSTLPSCDWDDDVCGDCGFKHICGVEVKREAIKIEDDHELERNLIRREEIKSFVNEYEKLDKEIKEKCKGVEKALIGDYFITGKMIQKNMKAKEACTQEYWQTKISNLKEV